MMVKLRLLSCLLALAPIGAFAVDIIETASVTHTGQIVRANQKEIVVKVPQGEFPVPLSEVTNLNVPQPKEYEAALKALDAQKYADAAALLKPIIARLGGLPLDWVEEGYLKLGDALVGANSLLEAKKTFDGFKVAYPQSPRLAGLDVKQARLMVAQKQHPQAQAALKKFVEPLLAKKSISQAEEAAASEALVLLGDAENAQGQKEDALDHYLTVVALFDVDPSLTAEAKFKAAQLFEDLKKWNRAKGSYEELLESRFGEQAKQRLAALKQAHP